MPLVFVILYKNEYASCSGWILLLCEDAVVCLTIIVEVCLQVVQVVLSILFVSLIQSSTHILQTETRIKQKLY